MKKIILAAVLGIVATLAALPAVRSTEHRALDDEVRAHAPGNFATLSDGIVHYEVAGPPDGQPVVLVHGFSVPSYVWDPTFEALARAGFRVIRYDLYGRGYSDRPDSTYDRALFVRQLRELIDATGVRRPADVVGVSMGGAITAAFAAEHPDRVRRLVFIDPFNSAQSITPLDWPLVGEYVNRAYFVPSLPEQQLSDFFQPERFPDWPERYRRQMRYRGFASAILSTARSFVALDPLPDFRAVGEQEHPSLLIWGEEDRTLPFTQNVRVRRALGDPEFFAVPSAGHLPHYERPAIVNPALIAFLHGG